MHFSAMNPTAGSCDRGHTDAAHALSTTRSFSSCSRRPGSRSTARAAVASAVMADSRAGRMANWWANRWRSASPTRWSWRRRFASGSWTTPSSASGATPLPDDPTPSRSSTFSPAGRPRGTRATNSRSSSRSTGRRRQHVLALRRPLRRPGAGQAGRAPGQHGRRSESTSGRAGRDGGRERPTGGAHRPLGAARPGTGATAGATRSSSVRCTSRPSWPRRSSPS